MILVTGGTGLVGAHLLLDLAENGAAVRAMYRDSTSIEKTKKLFSLYKKTALFDLIEWKKGDLLEIPSLEKIFEGVETVYHCAALISFDPKDEQKLRKTNIEGTANIVNFCLAYQIKKLCYVSSIAALGDLAPHETIITEETEWNPEKPHSDYAISKYGAEMEIWRGQQEGLNTIIINPGVILGPGFDHQGSGLLFEKVKKGLKYYTQGSTGFVAVIDVVRLAQLLMNSKLANQRYVLIADSYLYRDIINSICDSMGLKQPEIGLKSWQLAAASKIDWLLTQLGLKKRALTQDMARTLHTQTNYSNQKIKKDLEIDFTDIHLYIKTLAGIKNTTIK